MIEKYPDHNRGGRREAHFAWELLDALAQGVAVLGAEDRFIFVNHTLAQMVGHTREGLIALKPSQMVLAEDLAAHFRRLQTAAPGEVIEIEIRIRHADGSWRWCYGQNRVFKRGPDGRVQEILTTVTNIVQPHPSQQVPPQSEVRYRRTLDNMLEGCQIIGFDWRYRYVNDAVTVQGKQTKEALLGRTMMEMYPGIEHTELFRLLRRCMNERVAAQMENEFIYPDGAKGWFELSIQPVPEGIFILSFDITRRKKAEEDLQQSKTELQHIIDTVPEGVLLLDNGGSIRLTNPVADQYLAVLAPERKHGRLTHLGGRLLNELLTSPPTKGLWHEISTDEYVFEAIARPVEHSAENTGWVLVLRDVTQERAIQQRAQRQDRLAAVGQMAAGIAHDFNNIMSVIIIYAQLVSESLEVSSRCQKRLATIEQQAKLAVDLIQQVLDFSRQSVMERRPLDLLPYMKELAKLLDRTLPEHIQVKLEYKPDESYLIKADPSRMQQVIMNLAVNARDAMPEGGHLHIRLAQHQTEKSKLLSVREMPPGRWVCIEMADSGSGIPPEVLPHIFEPFFTTKEVGQGTGLGLAQVYGIVQQHEGYIDIMTGEGRGTTFSLYFPALEDAEEVLLIPESASWQQGQGQVILIVEDDPDIREALADSLALLNYEALEAAHGREALAVLQAGTAEIDLILSDVVMPEMGGIALLRALRQQKVDIPLVLLTGHPLSKELEALRELGLAGWLPKPPKLADLSQIITQALAVD